MPILNGIEVTNLLSK